MSLSSTDIQCSFKQPTSILNVCCVFTFFAERETHWVLFKSLFELRTLKSFKGQVSGVQEKK